MITQNNLAYSYVRWSSAEQSKGDSLRRQLAKFQDYCNRKGLTPAEDSFTDRGRSGYRKEHLSATGELRRFLNLVQDGTIEPGSTLVIENLDRLGRQDVDDAYDVFRSMLRAGTGALAVRSIWSRCVLPLHTTSPLILSRVAARGPTPKQISTG